MAELQPFSIETTTVGLMIYNPTAETFDMQYAGVSLTMEPGAKCLYEIACAKHLLNAFGQRGLTSLTYGCDEEKVKKEAIQRNHDFKKKQVVEYNQRNEMRKQTGMGYLPPTPHVKKYAIELGLELLEPYAVRDEERAGITATKQENLELKAEMAELREMMKTLMSGKQTQKTQKEPEDKDTSDVKKNSTIKC